MEYYIFIFFFFLAQSDTPQTGLTGFVSASTAYMNGVVCKVGVKNFVKENQCRVLRSSSGVSAGFSDRVMEAMNSVQKYNAATNNCLHFAMKLLGVSKQHVLMSYSNNNVH